MVQSPRSATPAPARWPLFACAALALALAGCAAPTAPTGPRQAQPQPQPKAAAPSERPATARRDGRKQVGKASIYARKFDGRTMADGTPMSLQDDNAASKTLPLGSKARVRNLETGKSAVVTIQDRGPYVPGRIIDLSPATAALIGLTMEDGLADVEVTPLPPADSGETVERREQ
jgi:rare lipoprotein A